MVKQEANAFKIIYIHAIKSNNPIDVRNSRFSINDKCCNGMVTVTRQIVRSTVKSITHILVLIQFYYFTLVQQSSDNTHESQGTCVHSKIVYLNEKKEKVLLI